MTYTNHIRLESCEVVKLCRPVEEGGIVEPEWYKFDVTLALNVSSEVHYTVLARKTHCMDVFIQFLYIARGPGRHMLPTCGQCPRAPQNIYCTVTHPLLVGTYNSLAIGAREDFEIRNPRGPKHVHCGGYSQSERYSTGK